MSSLLAQRWSNQVGQNQQFVVKGDFVGVKWDAGQLATYAPPCSSCSSTITSAILA